MSALRWTVSASVALAVALPPPAGAVTFGANLDARTANSNATCAYPPLYPGINPYPGFPPYADSCTAFSTATATGEAAETQVVPLPDPASHGDQHGTITQVRIETGAGAPGPAKLTVLRAHRAINGGEAACCVGQAESAQFTLNPNTIVNVNTDLPVASLYDAGSQIYSYDILALSVLDTSTPIPAELSNPFTGYCGGIHLPYVQTGQERFTGEYSPCGFLVLMQADMTVAAKADDNGGEGGGGGGTPKFKLLGKPKTLGNGRVAINLELPGAGKLVGSATAKVPVGLLARPSRLAKLVVARTKLNVARAGKIRLLLKPRPAAKKVIDRRGKLKSKARVTYTPAAGATHSFSRSVFFK